jgi:S-DNA-T family DNA segregation ATPase FtsK/SpoIIIE
MKAAKAERTRRFELPFGLGGVFGKKDAKTTRTRASKAPRVEQGGLSLDTKLDIIGLALVVVAAALLLASLSPNQGAITGEINRFLSYLFGWGAIAIPFSMLAAGIWLLIRHFGEDAPTLPVQQVIGLAILYVTIITIMQFVKAFEYPPDALQSGLLPQFIELSSTLGQGGGYIGGQLYTLLITLAGEWAGFALLLIPLAVGLMLSVQLGFAELALVFISSLRNMRDQARTRAVRREAELAKRQEQRALAAQSAPQVAATSRPTEALPAGTRPALAPPPQSPVPVQLPLGASAEPRSIPITQGGRTITASFDTEADESELPVPVRPAASFAQAPAPEKPEAAARGGGLGRLIPGAVAGAAAAGAAAAFKALTPTEEADEFEPHDTVRRGLGGLRLPSLPGKKPDADKSPPAQPGANKPGGILSGLGQRRPDAAAPATPPTPAAAAPKPPIDTAPPAPTLSPAAPVQTPAPPPQTGQADDQQPAPRMGDLLRAGGSGLAAPARPSASDTEVGLKPASAGAGGSSLPGPRSFTPPAPPRAAPPLDIEADEDEDDDDLLAMKPAQPKGLGVAPRPASDTPFGPPRVMPVRGDSAATPEKPGEDAKRPQPAASVTPVGSWQDRMKALQGSLPGSDDGDKDKPADKPAAGSGSAAGSPLTPRPFSAGSDTQRQPPRIIKMDEDNQDIDDEDEDDLESLETASDAVKPAPMKPLSQPARPAAPTTGQPPGERPSPFAPRAPLTASSAFKRPETPPSIVRAPSPPAQTPPPPQQPAASISGSAANPPRVVTPAPTAPPAATAPPASAGEPPAAPRTGRREWKIPELSAVLASGMDQELDHALLLQRAKTIEETLESFGAPGRVVEVRTGPVITQFGVEPDYLTVRGGKKVRVKVSNIAQLDKDLQLALGAKSIRIEAPVPGKGYVGIEVPNEQASIVRLRDVMESEQFRKIKSPLAIALGQGVDGTPICADLTSMPHLLIAGTTGSGKSVCVNSIIGSLLLNNTPERLRFIMVDPKRVELTAYNGIPHLVSPVVVELERIVGVLKWVTREMDERYRRFSAAGARNIEDYNKHIPSGDQFMPYIIVIIDELADLMMLAPEETERVVTRLAALARATGIHLVIATQRPSVDVVTGLIKANFPARIAFAVAGSVDSRVILDQPGAERLLGRGDMLYMSGDSPAPQRLQGVFVSDTEINNITRSWRQQFDESTPGKLTITQFALDEMVKDSGSGGARSMGGGLGSGQPLRQQALWDRESGPTSYVSTRDPDSDDDGDIGEDGEDEMYEESVKLVRTLKKASVSLLQRRLRIGYTRAARLIDLMEERGVVGPAQSGSTPREVIG